MVYAAVTFLPADNGGDVPGAKSDKGQCFAGQCGHHHLPHFAVGHRLTCHGIDDLDQVMIFPNVNTFLLWAIDAHADPGRFSHTDYVESLDAHFVLDALAQTVAPTLSAEDAHP